MDTCTELEMELKLSMRLSHSLTTRSKYFHASHNVLISRDSSNKLMDCFPDTSDTFGDVERSCLDGISV